MRNRTPLYLGWDVGGTSCAAVVGDAAGTVRDRIAWDSQAHRGPEAMIERFLRAAETLQRRQRPFAACGVSIGGPLDIRRGVVLSPPHLPGWDRIPLRDRLAEALGLEICIEHDAAACLRAEHLWGAARGCRTAIYLTCGTGCGAGVMVGGRILRGSDGQSPEAGHIRVADDGPVCFGKAGSAESFSSGKGLGLLAGWMFPQRFGDGLPPRKLVELLEAQDADARAVLDESARRTGQFIAALADIFCPQAILLGSLARYLPACWLAGVRESYRREALPDRVALCEPRPTELLERLQDLSAIAPCLPY